MRFYCLRWPPLLGLSSRADTMPRVEEPSIWGGVERRAARFSWRWLSMASVLTVWPFLQVVFGNRARGGIKARKEGLARYI